MRSEVTIKVATTSEEVVEAQRIRKEIFVGEQGIPAHLDADGLDESAFHVLCWIGSEPVATGRLVVLEPHDGVLARIAVLPEYRGRGLGRLLVNKLEILAAQQGLEDLTLHPHKHLEKFYRNLGFKTVVGTSLAGQHELITMQKRIGATHARSADGSLPLATR